MGCEVVRVAFSAFMYCGERWLVKTCLIKRPEHDVLWLCYSLSEALSNAFLTLPSHQVFPFTLKSFDQLRTPVRFYNETVS